MCSCKTELDLLARPEVQDELSKIKVVIKRGFPAAGPPLPVLREIDDITKIELHLDDVERTPLFSRPGIICNTYDCPKDRLHEERNASNNALTISFNNTNDDSSNSEDTHVRKVLCASTPRSEEYRQHNRNDLYEKDKTSSDKPRRRSLTRASCSSRIKRRSRSRSPRHERTRSRDYYRRSRSRSSRRERSRSRERHAVSNKGMDKSRSSRSTRSRSRSRERQYYVPHHIPPTHMPGFFSYPRMPYGYRFPGPGIYAYPPMHIPFVPRYPNYGLPMTNRNSMPNGVERNSRRSEQVHKENVELTD